MPDHSTLLADLSPERLQRLIDRLKSKAAPAPDAQRIPRRTQEPEGEDRLPLSFSQERLWFLDRLEPGTATYNIPLAVALLGVLRPGVLARALRELVRRHEALRTTFETVEGAPRQRISARAACELPVVDLAALSEAARETEAARLAEEHARTSFDLEAGPLFAAALLRFGRDTHRFLLVLHHIVADGWSLGVLVRELGALYEAFNAGRPSPLHDLPVQYPDFALWQRRTFAVTDEQELGYWEEKLDGVEPLELPTDRPRPAVQTYRGGTCSLAFSAELSRRLRDFGRSCKATPFMVLLSLVKALFRRHSGQDDVVLGSPIAGRGKVETEGLIGFFLNTLVLRTNLSGDPGLRELVARVREVTLGAYSHQDVPFEALLARLQPERDLSRTPLFQVLFNMLNFPVSELRQPGLELRVLSVPQAPSKFDMTFYVQDGEEGLRIQLVYNADLFDEERMAGLLDQLALLAERAAERPDAPLGSLPLVTASSRGVLPDPAESLDAGWIGAVHERFVENARRSPGRIAVEDGDGAWTYANLDAASSRIAGWLQRQGVRRGDCVAVYAHRSAPVVPAVLGTLRAGAAFTMLDPAYPAARLAEILEIAAPRALVRLEAAGPLPAAVAERLAATGCEVLGLPAGGAGAVLGRLDGCPAGEPVEVGPGDVACIGFTSGSTGRPKGILGLHGPLSHFLPWQCERFGLTGEDRFSLLSGLAHDPLQRDLFTPLYLGAAIVVPDPADVGVPGRLAAWMARERVTVAHLTPAMAQLVTEGAEDGQAADLRLVLLVGDVLTRLDVARIRALAPRVTCVNLYGSTETQRAVAFHVAGTPEEGSGEAAGKQVLPLGRGMKDVQLLVLNRAGDLAGVGELGEIAVRSPHLALGYLGDEALTADRFRVNPFTGEAGDRIYRTGDLGRYLPNGEVVFAGRSDFQVKIRGYRIELGEIEATLAGLAGVREAIVAAQEDGGEKRLAAFVVPEPGARIGEESLRDALRERLPSYMVPAAFELLPALPITPNGKVDRRALSLRTLRPAAAAEGYMAPRNPIEEVLASLWAEVLRHDRVSIDADFFALGGHSLLVTRLVSRIRAAFDVELPLRALFDRPTVAGLAHLVEEAMRTASGPVAPPLERVPREGDLPLSFAQQRLWFLDQLEPGSSAYNMPVALRVEGPLDAGVLALCLGEIVRRHEPLRTVFTTLNGAPVQVIQPASPFVLPLVDLSGLPEIRREPQAFALAGEEVARPFDLTGDPLLRGVLLRLTETDHAVALTLHHIASDGWSMGILVREVVALYAAFSVGRPSPLPELPVQYADFAAWQHSWLRGEVLEGEIAYWRRQLAGLPPLLELPTDRPRSAAQSYRGASRPVRLSAALTRQARALSRNEGATLFMVLLSGFQILLARSSGQRDFAVGTPIAGRNRLETEGLIGFFVNTLVMRGNLTGEPSFRELLGRVREAALASHTHQDVPFEKLVQELAPERSLQSTPLFQVFFALQNAPQSALELPSLALRTIPMETGAAKFDLSLAFQETAGGIVGSLEYAVDLFDSTTAHRLLARFEQLLAGAVENPDLPVGALPFLSEAERHQALLEWNDTQAFYPRELSLPELFTAAARSSPDHLAVVSNDRLLTYRKMDEASNRLARQLRVLGVGPEVVVGLCMDRSPELILAILAILKAGGAYLPLDPGSPEERLALMLADAGADIVLADAKTRPSLEGRAQIVEVDLEMEGDHGPLEAGVVPEGLAYVLYTSGSTGRPKGVACTHRGVVNLLTDMERRRPLSPGEGVSLWTSVSFDVSVFEIFSALGYGATLHIPSEEVRGSAETFFPWLHRHRIRSAYIPPFLLPGLAERVCGDSEEGRSLARLLVGVEPIPEQLLANLRLAVPGLAIVNGYGPTEATICATFYDVGQIPELDRRTPIGLALANCRVRLLDPNLHEVPPGVLGEICIGGVGLARGYCGDPGRTAEKFVPDPFGESSGELGARLYRTGDLARRLEDGNLLFLGRQDHQVKVRGVRIELGEIEQALNRHQGVHEAVALVRQDPRGEKHLIAYVVPRQGPVEDWRELLRRYLPDTMLPSLLISLAALPLTPSGKVDRQALPEPDWNLSRSEQGFPGTLSPVEDLLASIWADVLGLDQVGAHADFFALGGHSLLATQVASRIRTALRVELPLRRLFESRTIAELAREIREIREGIQTPPLVPVPREGPLPLSFAQQRLWFIDQLDPGRALYNIPVVLRVEGPLRSDVLMLCVGEIVRRHEVLRTTFAATEGLPLQVIQQAATFVLPVVDLSGLPESRREGQALALAGEEARRSFDLSRDPLLRGVLVRVAEGDHVLALSMHHIVSDGWSMGILVREVTTLYQAFLEEKPSPLPELPIQYADFAVWQRNWLHREVREGLVEHWRQRLAGALLQLDLPGGRPRPAAQSPRGAARQRRFAAPLLKQLRALGRHESATLFMTLLAPLQALLHARTGATDLVVGTDVAGRDRREAEGLIGFFINQLPLRANLAGDPTLRELLGRARETAIEAYSHQDLPFDHLVEALQVQRSLQRSPVFQVKLVLQNAPRESFDLPGLTFKVVPLSTEAAQLDLHWSFAERGEELWLKLTYSTDLYDELLIDELLDEYESWLHAFAERPDAQLGEVTAELAQAGQARQAELEIALKSVGFAKRRSRSRRAVELGRHSQEPEVCSW